MKILHIIDTLDYHASARQLQLLTAALTNAGVATEVCCLGPETPWSHAMRRAGVVVHTLGWTRWFDPIVPWSVRALLTEAAPDVVHAWRPTALRMLGVVARRWLPRVVASAPLPTNARIGWLDRWLLGQVGATVVAGAHEATRCIGAGIAGDRMRLVPPLAPAVSSASNADPGSIVCIGRLERVAGYREAVCAFDFIRHRFTDTRLRLVGDGTLAPNLRALIAGLDCGNHVNLLSPSPEIAPHLERAAVVWVPSLANVGQQVALEAMAHGRPVVGFDVPCLRDVVKNGETGFLVPVGDFLQLARRTRDLLVDPALGARLGETARQRIEPAEAIAGRWRDVYQQL